MSDPARVPPESRAGDAATISVVIPAYQRPERLSACLEALAAQRFPTDRFEVVVVDDESPEPVAPMVTAFAHRFNLQAMRQPHAGPAAARNHGARQASGRYLAFIDDDCTPNPDWLARLAEAFDRYPDHLLGGAVVNALPDDPFATTSQLIQSCRYEFIQRHPTSRRFFSTSNLAVPSDRFHALGGFSEAFQTAAGEDYDFCDRWSQAGYPSAFAAAAVVRHAHALGLDQFCRQHFGYGRALLHLHRRIAARDGGVLRLEPARYYVDLLTYPLRQDFGLRGWFYAGLVMLSQGMTGLGALRELLSRNRH